MKKKKLLVLINELKNEKEKIIEYIDYHSNPFPEIVKDLQNKPIGRMRIYINQLIKIILVPSG